MADTSKSLLDTVDDAAYLKDATFAAYMATRDDASCGEQVTQALRWLTHQTHEMAHDLHQALNALHEASRDGAKPPQDQDRPAASSPPSTAGETRDRTIPFGLRNDLDDVSRDITGISEVLLSMVLELDLDDGRGLGFNYVAMPISRHKPAIDLTLSPPILTCVGERSGV